MQGREKKGQIPVEIVEEGEEVESDLKIRFLLVLW